MAIREFDDVALDQLARSVAKALSEARTPRSNWDRRLTLAIGVISIVSLIFSFGVNWSRLAENENKIETVTKRVDQHEADLKALRIEMGNQGSEIQRQLGDIKERLGQIQGTLSRR